MDTVRQSPPEAVVVGAGIGGLAAALVLASHGVAVTVLERASRPGGKIRPGRRPDLDLDTGPTVLTMPWVFEALFALVGAGPPRLQSLPVLAHHRWPCGGALDLYADAAQSAEAIGRFAGAAEARRYTEFCGRAAAVHAALVDSFIRAPRGGLAGMLRRMQPRGMLALLACNPFRTLASALAAQFRDPRLQQLFARYATYYGSSPYHAPATLMLIAHVERCGVWRLDGGLRALAARLADEAARAGAAFRYSEGVARLETDGRGAIAAVHLDNGERLAARHVVVNADTHALACGLFGQNLRHAVPPTPRRQRSLSAFTFAGHGRLDVAGASYHNVFFSDNYRQEFDELLEGDDAPQRPTVYLCAPDRGERSDASGDPERLFLLVNGPANGDRRRYGAAERSALERRVAAQLSACGVGGLALDEFELTTPADFAARFPATGGALYGRATHGWYAAFRRSGSRTRVNGLYVAGGSAHPGAGVPMAALSGMRAARSLLEDIGARCRDLGLAA